MSEDDLAYDCLNFLRVDGKPVKAARLFLGNEYKIQIKQLHDYFGREYGYHRSINFDESIYSKLQRGFKRHFKFESITIPREEPLMTNLEPFSHFEEAYHQLMLELVELQVDAVRRAMGNTLLKKIYIDGGFAKNEIYIELMRRPFPEQSIIITPTPLGSALGAAMVILEGL